MKRRGWFESGGGNMNRDGQRVALPCLHVKGDAATFQVDGILAHETPIRHFDGNPAVFSERDRAMLIERAYDDAGHIGSVCNQLGIVGL
jgi:hypothetical protein